MTNDILMTMRISKKTLFKFVQKTAKLLG